MRTTLGATPKGIRTAVAAFAAVSTMHDALFREWAQETYVVADSVEVLENVD
jgi:hypothetical protein